MLRCSWFSRRILVRRVCLVRFSSLPTNTEKPRPRPSLYATPFHSLLEPLRTSPQLLFYAPIFQYLTAHHNFLNLGKQVHAHMALHGIQPNSFVAAKMVAMYASSGDLDSSIDVFEKTPNPSLLLCNSIVRAYAKYGCSKKCIDVYSQMHSDGLVPDNFTIPFVLKSCGQLSSLWLGKCVHGQSLKLGLVIDMYVGTSLVDMYVRCGKIIDARKLFDKMSARDVSSWNVLIAGYMRKGDIGAAEDLFRGFSFRNIVSWTAMISGYAQNGYAEEALCLFDEMMKNDSEAKPNWVTIMSVLPSCGQLAALDRGRKIHEFSSQIGLDSNYSVQTALIAMYAKCGSLVSAHRSFERIPKSNRNLIAWNAMITAYSSHGCGNETVLTFEEMVKTNIRPDEVTFTALLSGCSHAGLTDIGLNYFYSIKPLYSIEPRHEHYACVVDLLGRANRLLEAIEFVDKMPMPAGPSIWGALLSASRNHQNLDVAEIAAKKLFVLEPNNSGNYVVLSNIYAESKMWDRVDNTRHIVKSQGMKKNTGCSWIEVNGKPSWW